MKLTAWEKMLLQFVAAALPTVENLFIHNAKSIAIFNASENVFNGVVQQLTTAPAQTQGAGSTANIG